MRKPKIDTSNTDPAYWNRILRNQGLSADVGTRMKIKAATQKAARRKAFNKKQRELARKLAGRLLPDADRQPVVPVNPGCSAATQGGAPAAIPERKAIGDAAPVGNVQYKTHG